MAEGSVKAADFLEIVLLAVMLYTRDYQDYLCHFCGFSKLHNFYTFAYLAHCGLLLYSATHDSDTLRRYPTLKQVLNYSINDSQLEPISILHLVQLLLKYFSKQIVSVNPHNLPLLGSHFLQPGVGSHHWRRIVSLHKSVVFRDLPDQPSVRHLVHQLTDVRIHPILGPQHQHLLRELLAQSPVQAYSQPAFIGLS